MTGKKHEKRLAYLKFSLDTVADPPLVQSTYSSQYLGPPASSHPILSTGLPTVYAYPPPCASYGQSPAYYYPGPPLQQPYPTYPTYHEYQQGGPPQAPPPGPSPSTSQHAPRQGRRREGGTGPSQGGVASHGVMSPSLTSGFSGSGDCKSTETCSLLSVASYSSVTPAGSGSPGGRNGVEQSAGPSSSTASSSAAPPRHVVTCEVCHLPFPSRAVLEHHLVGSRHARKVKAESVLRQLQEGGAEFRATEATGDIRWVVGATLTPWPRCEVCEVSVNSSHQLQAHMIGGGCVQTREGLGQTYSSHPYFGPTSLRRGF